jgi:microsomal dipeptidase-like Zn-dependent dipeptidase
MRNGRWSKEMDYGEGSKANADWPRPLSWFRDSRDFPNITRGLQERGFRAEDIAKVMGVNWLNLFDKGLKPQVLES